MIRLFKNIGPGTLVAAAFIGPGTVTVCTLAGVEYGFTLLWAMLLSIVATIVLQEMAARLGLIHGSGLAATVRQELKTPVLKYLAIFMILSAILIGNAAYEAGNIGGGILGLETAFNSTVVEIFDLRLNYLSFILGMIAFIILYIGKYKLIEKSLISLVVIMSIAFLITAISTRPNLTEVLHGMFIPTMPEGSLLMVIAIVGTTVVPYNLFLHASLVREKWKDVSGLRAARTDTVVSIILGGVVSMAIIICAAAVNTKGVSSAADLAVALQPVFGVYSKYLISIGLFAAGLTSAITAPLAAAYVASECFGWEKDMRTARFRAVWVVILSIGVIFASLGINPIEVIRFAQVANGLLLPVIAGFLLWVMNRTNILGIYRNSKWLNGLGLLIVFITLILSLRSLYKVFAG